MRCSSFLFPVSFGRVCSSSETESEAGDLLEQQFEELNNKLTSATDPTGYLRMVSRNNLFNRSEFGLTAWREAGPTLSFRQIDLTFATDIHVPQRISRGDFEGNITTTIRDIVIKYTNVCLLQAELRGLLVW